MKMEANFGVPTNVLFQAETKESGEDADRGKVNLSKEAALLLAQDLIVETKVGNGSAQDKIPSPTTIRISTDEEFSKIIAAEDSWRKHPDPRLAKPDLVFFNSNHAVPAHMEELKQKFRGSIRNFIQVDFPGKFHDYGPFYAHIQRPHGYDHYQHQHQHRPSPLKGESYFGLLTAGVETERFYDDNDACDSLGKALNDIPKYDDIIAERLKGPEFHHNRALLVQRYDDIVREAVYAEMLVGDLAYATQGNNINAASYGMGFGILHELNTYGISVFGRGLGGDRDGAKRNIEKLFFCFDSLEKRLNDEELVDLENKVSTEHELIEILPPIKRSIKNIIEAFKPLREKIMAGKKVSDRVINRYIFVEDEDLSVLRKSCQNLVKYLRATQPENVPWE